MPVDRLREIQIVVDAPNLFGAITPYTPMNGQIAEPTRINLYLILYRLYLIFYLKVFAHGRGMSRAQAQATRGPNTAAALIRRRPTGRRRVSKKPSVIRRVGQAVWVSPRHAVLAFTTGFVCGAVAARVDGLISPPYAAILGTLVGYPAIVAVWRRLPRVARRR